MSSSSCKSHTLWVFLPASWIQKPSSSVAFFKIIFFLPFLWAKTLKNDPTLYIISNPFRPPPLFTRKYLVTKGPPLLQVLHAPPLPRIAELQDGEGHPRASVGGGVSSPWLHGTVQLSLRCFAAHPSQCLWSVSSGVTWAFEGLSKEKKRIRQWRRLYIKTWQKS